MGTIGATLIILSYFIKSEKGLLFTQLLGSFCMLIYSLDNSLMPVLIINLVAILAIVYRLEKHGS